MDFGVFNELRLQDKLCDVVIKAGQVEFRAHKIILCGCSSYFRTLFTGSWNSPETRLYTIPSVSPDMMQLILDYIYTGQIQITAENVVNLLPVADYLGILGLLRLCCEFLKGQLSVDNCIGIRRYADTYFCRELQDQAHTFILQRFEEIVRGQIVDFLDMSLLELSDILEDDHLNVRQEETAFTAVMKWIEHDPEQRSPCIVTLLPKVRMGLMDPNYILSRVCKNQLVRSYRECKPIITRTLRTIMNINMNGLTNHFNSDPLCRPRFPSSVLYAIGGSSERNPINAVEAYDYRTDTWRRVFYTEETSRAYLSTAYLGGFIYVFGGCDSVDYFSSVCKFDPINQTWHEVAPMHSKRCYVSVVALGGHIYAMGGFDGHVRLNTAERYSPETNQWSLIAPMNEQRSDASATTLNGKIYICGGFNGNEYHFTGECYDPETGVWTLIEPMHERRSGLGIAALNNQIFAVGGFNGVQRLQNAEAYSPESNSWRIVSSMFRPRSNFGIEVLDQRLYVIGGYNGFGTTSRCEFYDVKINEWFDVQDMNIKRSAVSCCVVPALPNVADYTFSRNTPDV